MEGLTARLATAAEAFAAEVAAADIHVEGLGFTASGITYAGLPFEQAGSAKRLAVSFAIGAPQPPELGIMLISDASLMDRDSKRLVAELAEEHGMDVLMEVVAGDRPEGIIIEDGGVISLEEWMEIHGGAEDESRG